MGWNGSDKSCTSGSHTATPKNVFNHQSGLRMRGLVAGLVVAVLGVITIWTVRVRAKDNVSGETQSPILSRIPSVAKHLSSETSHSLPSAEREASREVTPTQTSISPVLQPSGEHNVRPIVLTNRIVVSKSRYEVFDHPSEEELCLLSTMPIGTLVIGNREYDEEFMKDLQQAMVEKIEIAPDDPEDVRYYKESVIAMKKEIAQLLKSGADIAKVLTETRNELQKLGVYKLELEQAVDEFRNADNECSDEEVEAIVKKANEMLKEKGIEPFEFNSLTREIIKRNPFASPEEQARQDEEIMVGNEEALEEREQLRQIEEESIP